MAKTFHAPKSSAPRELRLGFVPLTDCAPLVMAQELGFFLSQGLRVRLSRELGWASVRDKIIHGELEAAHALAAMPLAVTLGLGSAAADCLTALVLNLHGNAITLSSELWRRGVRDGHSLREAVQASKRDRILTFGVVFPFSSHRNFLRKWLLAQGIDPEHDVRLVVVPPPQLAHNLKAGNLDGFCAGEPWNSVAVQMRAGWIAATSAEFDPGHPEKVLMVRRDFAENRALEHAALVAALQEACAFCDAPENRARIAEVLAQPQYVGVAAKILLRGLWGELDCGEAGLRRVEDFFVWHRREANEPSDDKAAWALGLMRTSGLCPPEIMLNCTLGRRIFRRDLYEVAIKSPKFIPTSPAQPPSNLHGTTI